MSLIQSLTVLELKEILRAHGRSASGNKAELTVRLMEADPTGEWIRELTEVGDDGGEMEAVRSGDETENVENDGDDVRVNGAFAGPSGRGPPARDNRIDGREVDFSRRERDLMERELELARREIAFLRSANAPAAEPERGRRGGGAAMKVNINTVVELLEDFSGDGEVYDNWEKRVGLLRLSYGLDDNMMKILIGSRLKGRASAWFHSKAEHVEMPLDELLGGLRTMFAHRSNRVAKRKLFESRVWKRGEVFADYLHDKIIMANQVPVDESEIVDYVVEGIPDPSLRDQARMQRFESTAQLLQAFEKVMLRSRGQPNGTGPEDKSKQKREEKIMDDRRCFNCGRKGHLSAKCPTKSKGMRCFRCSGYGHVAADCTGAWGAAPEANAVADGGKTARFFCARNGIRTLS